MSCGNLKVHLKLVIPPDMPNLKAYLKQTTTPNMSNTKMKKSNFTIVKFEIKYLKK